MRTNKLSLTLLSLISVSLAQVQADSKAETYSKTTNAAGTSVSTETSHADTVAADGVRKSSDTVKTVVNPKGVLNEESVKTREDREAEPNGDFSNDRTVVHADGTVEKTTTSRHSDKHWTNKGETKTTKQTHSIDPVGLGNKSKVELKEEVESNPGTAGTKTVTKKVNGAQVSEETTVIPK